MKSLVALYLDIGTYHRAVLLERVAMVRLIELEKNYDALLIIIPWSVQQDSQIFPVEINKYIEKYMESVISTIPVAFTDEKKKQKQLIQDILFGDREISPADEADIEHVFEAQIYNAAFFVTVDKNHIFSKAQQFLQHFKLQVMTPSQCLSIVEQYLKKERANYADLFKNRP